MKRVTYASADQLRDYCLEEGVDLVVEYRDEERKQRQVVLKNEDLSKVEDFLSKPEAMAYYRNDGIFCEVVAAWRKK